MPPSSSSSLQPHLFQLGLSLFFLAAAATLQFLYCRRTFRTEPFLTIHEGRCQIPKAIRVCETIAAGLVILPLVDAIRRFLRTVLIDLGDNYPIEVMRATALSLFVIGSAYLYVLTIRGVIRTDKIDLQASLERDGQAMPVGSHTDRPDAVRMVILVGLVIAQLLASAFLLWLYTPDSDISLAALRSSLAWLTEYIY